MLSVDFINVGYGDAIFIRDCEADFSMLVDCGDVTIGDGGTPSSRISAADFLQKNDVHMLDLLVLTHLHRDHSGGLTEVLHTVQVREFWSNYLPPQKFWGRHAVVPAQASAGARCLLESMNILLDALSELQKQGTAIRLMQPDSMTLCFTKDLKAEICSEEKILHEQQTEIWKHVLEGSGTGEELDHLDQFINNTSIRMRLSFHGKTVELPGDIYADCWEKHRLSPCTIVKLPHHGHRDSITTRLLDMLRPQHVVISVSNSRKDDCPAEAVLRELEARPCTLHITDAVCANGRTPHYHPSVHFTL